MADPPFDGRHGGVPLEFVYGLDQDVARSPLGDCEKHAGREEEEEQGQRVPRVAQVKVLNLSARWVLVGPGHTERVPGLLEPSLIPWGGQPRLGRVVLDLT